MTFAAQCWPCQLKKQLGKYTNVAFLMTPILPILYLILRLGLTLKLEVLGFSQILKPYTLFLTIKIIKVSFLKCRPLLIKGVHQRNIILCALRRNFTEITYCPILPSLVTYFLIYTDRVEQVFEHACIILNSNRNIVEINRRETEVILKFNIISISLCWLQISNSVLCDLCQMKLSKNDLTSAKFDQLNLNEWRLWFFKAYSDLMQIVTFYNARNPV